MKKLVALSLTVALCLGMFSACSGGGTSSVANSGSASTADSQGSAAGHQLEKTEYKACIFTNCRFTGAALSGALLFLIPYESAHME